VPEQTLGEHQSLGNLSITRREMEALRPEKALATDCWC
jgi:hypothetical protein